MLLNYSCFSHWELFHLVSVCLWLTPIGVVISGPPAAPCTSCVFCVFPTPVMDSSSHFLKEPLSLWLKNNISNKICMPWINNIQNAFNVRIVFFISRRSLWVIFMLHIFSHKDHVLLCILLIFRFNQCLLSQLFSFWNYILLIAKL